LLPISAQHRTGWYVWGLVAGVTQTRFPWGWPPGGPEPHLWFHDLLDPDSTPYDDMGVSLLRESAQQSNPTGSADHTTRGIGPTA